MKEITNLSNEEHSHPSNWKLGMFYFNRNDKRIFPPKKYKYTGWTINFANPYSIAALVAVVILSVGIGVNIHPYKSKK